MSKYININFFIAGILFLMIFYLMSPYIEGFTMPKKVSDTQRDIVKPSLLQLNNTYTDKNTTHSYFELYDKLLTPIRASATKVLEVGIGDFGEKNGGSIKLWKEYFDKATIYGLDILPEDRVLDELKTDDRVILFNEVNAYDPEFVKNEFGSKNLQFDFLLDDGPHTLESMVDFIKLYTPLMKSKAILIIEDVKSLEWIEKLKSVVPSHLVPFTTSYDRRKIKGRYDDIVFCINTL